MLRLANCITDRVWSAIQEPIEWQHIGDHSDAAIIFPGTHFLKVYHERRRPSLFSGHRWRELGFFAKERKNFFHQRVGCDAVLLA